MGAVDNSGAATCQQDFQGCSYIPILGTPGFSCRAQELCNAGGCNGSLVRGLIATCQDAFKGCACLPVSTTPGFECGISVSCGNGDCNGISVNGKGICQNHAQGCPCILEPGQGSCSDQLCSAPDCNGNNQAPAGFSGAWSTCTTGDDLGYPCVLGSPPPPAATSTTTTTTTTSSPPASKIGPTIFCIFA